jgi:inner membrane protein
VENIAHTLVGAALAKGGLDRRTPLATPTLIVAANLPDIDILGTLFGLNYLDFHRGITHAVAGVAGLSVALAGTVWAAHRAAGAPPERRARFRPLCLVALIGLLTHPLLDYLNDYGIRPWLPFSDRRYYGDLLSIVDPWLWIILGVALFFATSSWAGRAAWIALGILLGSLIFWAAGPAVGLKWLAAIPLAGGAAWLLRKPRHRPVRVSLMAFVGYLAGTALMHGDMVGSAVAMAPKVAQEPVRTVSVLPASPHSHHRWTIVIETDLRYHIAEVAGLDRDGTIPPFQVFEKNLTDPCYRSSLGEEQIAALSRFARFPAVASQPQGAACTVILRDLRYARRAMSGWGVARATVSVRPASE